MWIECSMSSKSKCSSAFREINWHEIWTWHGIWTLLDLTIHHKRSYTNPVRNTRSSSTDFCSRKWMVDELTLPSKQLLPLSWFLAISNSRVIRRIRKQEISLVQITPETPLREEKYVDGWILPQHAWTDEGYGELALDDQGLPKQIYHVIGWKNISHNFWRMSSFTLTLCMKLFHVVSKSHANFCAITPIASFSVTTVSFNEVDGNSPPIFRLF